ncbi:ABC transporter permease subunit [Sporosarcina cascadiensis]|uniref:ABC transporter permease subunit n=1 Tax=Sporosarcina cascadiensis TaxID=2660747 RepID=UPI00129BA901|nr:ABC transporter permease subunit [Sporosarcina cascadiensis]
MRMILNEMKKILTWRMLTFLLLVNTVLYFLLISFDIEYFPNGRPALDGYRLGIEMIEEYGVKMDEEDMLDFSRQYKSLKKEADEYLQARPEFAAAGLENYEKLITSDWNNEEQQKLSNQIFHEEQVDLFWELQERSRLMEFHDMKEMIGFEANALQQKRFDELLAEGKYQAYSEVVIQNFKDFIVHVGITVLFSVVLLISPFILKDRTRRLLDLQYTAKVGRNLYKTKLIAGILSAGMVITVLLAFYFSLYAQNGTSPYFGLGVNAFIANLTWYDPTFLQYIWLCILAIYVIGIIFTMLAMTVSSVVPNFVTLIGIQIPLLFVMLLVGFKILLSHIISVQSPQWLVPCLYGLLSIVSAGLLIYLIRREKLRDILE